MVSCHLRIALVSLAALALFVLFVGRADIAGPHEARVAQVARRMAQSGWPWQARLFPVVEVESREIAPGVLRLAPRADGRMLTVNPWMIPVIGHEIRLQKPPLPYWCSATAFLVLGTSEFAARLTPALLGAISVLLFYGLAVALLGRRGGWLATLVYLTSYFVSQEYRKVMADPYLAFFTLLSLWAWVMACRRRSAGLTILFYVALALGAMAKGPVIFIHVTVPMVAWRIFVGDKLPGRWRVHVAGVCLFAVLALPWVLYVVSHIPGVIEIWRYESIGEMADNKRNARPFWVYLSIFYLAMPWTPLWISALAAPWIRKRRRLWFAWTWCIVMVVFFSCVNLKKDAYLLPIMPAVALMSGAALLRLMAAGRTVRNAKLFKSMMTVQIGIGIVAGLALMIGLREVPLLAGVAALTGGLALLSKGRPERWLGLQFIVYFVISMLYVAAYLPLSQNRGSARHFAPAAMAEQAARGLRFLPDQVTEGMAFYFPLDMPTATASESRVLAIGYPKKKGKEANNDWGGTYDATVIPLEPAKNMNGFKLYNLTRKAATTQAPRVSERATQ